MHLKYVSGTGFKKLKTFRNIFVIDHPRKPGSWYYVSTYKNFKNQKDKFFKLIGKYGQEELRRKWDFHHIVEGQHLKPFFTDEEEFGDYYNYVWPTVLINKLEHQYRYNSVLHNEETEILFPIRKDISVKKKLNYLKSLYSEAYSDDSVLLRIAKNVISDLTALVETEHSTA